MPDNPRALLLSPEPPYPLAGGGSLRTASLLEYLRRRFETDVIVFRESGAPNPEEALRANGFTGGVRCVDLPRHSRAFAARAIRNALRAARGVPSLVDRYSGYNDEVASAFQGRTYQVGVIEHFWCAPYLDEMRARCEFVWLDLHNVESVLQDRSAGVESWPTSRLYQGFAANYRRLEASWLPCFDRVLAASDADRGLIRAAAPGALAIVYPNAIPERARPDAARDNAIAFSANFAYGPNVAAVRWFASEVWPLLRSAAPDVEWRLIGKNPEAVGRFIGNDARIKTTGPVEDAIGHLARAKVAVAPLISGSGTRLKIIEAWAAGCAVVSTKIGAEGLDAQNGKEIVIADSARAMSDAVALLLRSPERREELASAGRRLYESRYTWPVAWRALDQAAGIGTSTA